MNVKPKTNLDPVETEVVIVPNIWDRCEIDGQQHHFFEVLRVTVKAWDFYPPQSDRG